jgi:uncharacterized phage protein (TIGR01671 family)
MKREILFRARPLDVLSFGKWVQGSLIDMRPINGQNAGVFILTEQGKIEVNSETVGQFTGLTTKNGVNIFEGDIVKFIDVNSTPIPFSESVNEVFWWNAYSCFSLKKTRSDLTFITIDGMEVISNIHDNPELL